jgi:predicted secreted Zn-dependent protease
MRRWLWLGLVVGLSAVGTAPAMAGVTVAESQKTYAISGASGIALLQAMDKTGPKHGFLTRAIAQTSYSVSWTIEWGETRTACRVKRAEGKLDITYTYPRVANSLSPRMQKRWNTFLLGVRRHEAHHGQMARQMAHAAEKSVAGMTIRNDPGCRKSRKEVKRRMSAVYADYEARQIRFDSKEHKGGGKVEDLIEALVR